ncbi:tetratricopeptide repeat protein [Sphingomonas canadensis]|uniref:Tetratricopeptide repeat protein n=1 Tax=Sphingomonas canadensis TaxID=1219257 RepID=A0ABW3H7L3_9SPHN|nr:tetratricopeptide repeat protein [Sphingomonas canadensis]MCW3836709.1 tetratricopeptide repeat protein [Sphingomonas canadensis]
MAPAALAQAQTGSQAQASGDDLTAYVRARAADADGSADVAAIGYAAALDDIPGDQVIAYRAYRQGLAAGDYRLAARASAALTKAGIAPADTTIIDVAVALDARDALAAHAALKRMEGGPLDFMAPVIGAWMAFERGEDPFRLLDPDHGNALERRYAAEHRALLLIASGRADEGLAALRPLLTAGDDSGDLRIDAALLLAAGGRDADARALLGTSEPGLDALRGRIATVKPGARFGAARMFVSLAAQIGGEEMEPLSIVLTRSAMLLDPADDRARLHLAEALSRSGSARLALAALAEVKPGSPFARGAAAGSIAVLRRDGKGQEAIALARTLATRGDTTAADLRTYGDLLFDAGRFADSADAYSDAIGRAGGDGGWRLHFLRGKALERAGKWKPAVAALNRAISLAPDEPEPLSYLGTAQLARGVDPAGALVLLERARTLKPDDAEITAALAWGYYKSGDAARAVPLLEVAAETDPAGSQISEHLGDAYWQLGRRFEARYAWAAAALHAESGAATARIEAKIANGPAAAN